MGVAFSPDGAKLATAGRNIGIWETQSGKFIRFLVGHGRGAKCLAWSPDSRLPAWAVLIGLSYGAGLQSPPGGISQPGIMAALVPRYSAFCMVTGSDQSGNPGCNA